MNKIVKLNFKKNVDYSYEILISSGINIAEEIKKTGLSNNFAVIIDSNVYKLYRDKIKTSFDKEKLNYEFIIISSGEKSKTLKNLENISCRMIEMGFDRKSTVIAIGGGVVGDLAGFVAGTFMRGINFIQVPTTLLAQVDSSIGGKVAVDLKNGKNSSGLFYQPKKVVIDVDFLETLPEIELMSGLMEIVKHGIIKSERYFKFIEDNIPLIKSKNKETLINLIYESCLIKTAVVQMDERESGLRMILNFGHTIGHALEIASRYKLKHGIAVGMGMIKEAFISRKLGILDENDYERIRNLIHSFGIKEIKYNKEKVLKAIKSDKKNVKNERLDISVTIILPKKIGKVEIKSFNMNEIKDFLGTEV